jgi:Uma2 family endonuclease
VGKKKKKKVRNSIAARSDVGACEAITRNARARGGKRMDDTAMSRKLRLDMDTTWAGGGGGLRMPVGRAAPGDCLGEGPGADALEACDTLRMAALAQIGLGRGIEYPESDGKPMAETDLHRDEMVEAIEALKQRYRDDAQAYVAGNLLIYYEEGNIHARFAPDVFVVFGAGKRRRRIYKLWEEKRPPAFVLEVTSRGTRREDTRTKKALCAKLGVAEYFLYDPAAEYLKPPLQGFRLVSGQFQPIPPDAEGRVPSKVLGVLFTVENDGLRFIDQNTGERSLQIREQAESARQQGELAKQQAKRAKRAEERAEQAEKRAERAEGRAAAAEAELSKLRALSKKSR